MKQAIVIIGGYGSLWPLYLNMARRLEDLSGLQAVGVPLMPWDWWRANHKQDATNVLEKLENSVRWAQRKFQADRLVLVGHSAGGLIGRLYLHEEPVWGRAYGGVEHVAALITLGTPHCNAQSTGDSWFLSGEANRLVPGAFYGDRVGYRAVAGRFVQGRRLGRRAERHAFRVYRFFTGQGDLWGDGTVPLSCMKLDGAEIVTLEGVAHSVKTSGDWYGGSTDTIRRWWPEELARDR